MGNEVCILTGAFLWLFIVVLLSLRSIVIIHPHEEGVYIVLGKFKRLMEPGLNFRAPFIGKVIIVDKRIHTLDVPKQRIMTKDKVLVDVDAVIHIRPADSTKIVFDVQNYKNTTISLAQTKLRSLIAEMELDEVLYGRERINEEVRNEMNPVAEKWGVRVEGVEIKDISPAGDSRGNGGENV